MSNYYQPTTSKPVKKSNKKTIILVVVGILVVCCCLTAIIGGFLAYSQGYLDSIIGRLFGGADPVASVLPPETDIYISMDFLKLMVNTDYDDIINAFVENSGNPDINTKQDLIDEMDRSLDESYGITMTDDIFPWIGSYVGIGFLDVSLDEYGSPNMTDFVVAIQARDQPKADEFIQKIISEVEDQTGESFDSSDYQGVTLYEMNVDYQQMALGRSKDVVYLSNTSDNIQKAIDAQKGDALVDGEEFKSTMSTLPSDRVMAAFVGSNFISEMSSMDSGSAYNFGSFDMIRSAAVSLVVIEQGLKLDMTTSYNLDQLNEEQIAMLSKRGGTVETARYYPAETLVYLTGANLDKAWSFYRNLIVDTLGSEDDFNDSMSLFEDQVGFNPDTDLFPILDGPFAIGLYNDENSFLNEASSLPIGYLGVFETSQPDQMNSLVQDMVDSIQEQAGVSVNDNTSGDLTTYEIEMGFSNQAVASIGTAGNVLYIGTNNSIVEDASQKNGSLADDQRFKDMWSAFPGAMTPVMYANLTEMINMLEDISSQDLQILTPIEAIGMAASPLKGSNAQSSIILVISR